MIKNISIFFLFLLSISVYSQKDSLKIKTSYWEDQLYVNLTYNILSDQPDGVNASKVSYGVGFGYIKDIPLNKENTFALGLGLGYNYDFYNQNLIIDEGVFTTNTDATSKKIKTYNLEFPIQLRWRTSDAISYSFWRVYFGAKVVYNLNNKLTFSLDGQDFEYKQIDSYNRLQTGLELSVGYGTFSFYTYYGLSPMFKDENFDTQTLDTKVLKLGVIFYLL